MGKWSGQFGSVRRRSGPMVLLREAFTVVRYSEIGQRSNDNSVQKCVQTIYKAIEKYIMKVSSVLCYSLLSLEFFVMVISAFTKCDSLNWWYVIRNKLETFNSMFIIILYFCKNLCPSSHVKFNLTDTEFSIQFIENSFFRFFFFEKISVVYSSLEFCPVCGNTWDL